MKLIVKILITIMAIIIIPTIVFRVQKNIQKKLNRVNIFAIQNIKTNMNIRPLHAEVHNNVPIILYKHHNWECQTWEFIKVENDRILLKNLYTEKSIEPYAEPKTGMTLRQMSLGDGKHQYWIFEKQSDGTFYIKLADTILYLTSTSNAENSLITLEGRRGDDAQKWRLIHQVPII